MTADEINTRDVAASLILSNSQQEVVTRALAQNTTLLTLLRRAEALIQALHTANQAARVELEAAYERRDYLLCENSYLRQQLAEAMLLLEAQDRAADSSRTEDS